MSRSSSTGKLLWRLVPSLMVLLIPLVVTGQYGIGLVDLMLVNIIVVLGLNVIWGFAGQIALGQAGFVAIGAYTVALLGVQLHTSFWLSLLAGIVATAILAFILGLATLRLKSFYLGLATLGFGEIVTQVLLNWKALAQGANGIVNIPQASMFGFSFGQGWQQFYLLLAFVAVGAFVSQRLIKSRFGLECRAVRDDERAAEMMGINTFHIKIGAFVISGVFAAVAGGLYAQLYQAVSPDVFSFDYMVQVLAMLLIGGAGETGGAIVGAAIVTLLPEALRFLDNAYLVVYGFGLVALIIYAPKGLWGVFSGMISRRLSHKGQVINNEVKSKG